MNHCEETYFDPLQSDDNIREELSKLALEEEDMKSAGTLPLTFLPSDVFMARAK